MAEHMHNHSCDDGCECGCGCGCENDFGETDDIITLTDENGISTDFLVIDGVEYNDTFYLALTEADKADDEECEFIILKCVENENDENGESLVSIEDEDEFNAVMELFQAKIESAGMFDFEQVEEDLETEETEE